MWNQWDTIFDPVMTADPLHAVTGDSSQNMVFWSAPFLSTTLHLGTIEKHRGQLLCYTIFLSLTYAADTVLSILCCIDSHDDSGPLPMQSIA